MRMMVKQKRVKEFKSGTLSLGIDDIGSDAAAALVGAVVDTNGVLVSGGEDASKYVAMDLEQREQMANTDITGFIEFYLEFLLLTLQQRVILLHSQLQLLKERSLETKQMEIINIRGKAEG